MFSYEFPFGFKRPVTQKRRAFSQEIGAGPASGRRSRSAPDRNVKQLLLSLFSQIEIPQMSELVQVDITSAPSLDGATSRHTLVTAGAFALY
jgi:hypothetical protein